MAKHTVKDGDCMLSIAAKHGFSWKKLWDDAGNAKLKAKRKYPTVLKPGDVVRIPDRKPKEGDRPTDADHRFRRKATPAKLRLRLLHRGKPMANTDCVLTIDGTAGGFVSSSTDGDGRIEISVPPTVGKVTLQVGDSDEEHVLKLGWLDPVDSVSGLQARLNSLGFDCGKVDDDMGKNTRNGMNRFQGKRKTLTKTRNPDKATQDELEKSYGY